MNPGDVFLLTQPLILLAFVFVGWRWSAVRRGQEMAAAKFTEANTGAELCDEILSLQSNWRSGKQHEIDCRVQEMQKSGWAFLKMSEVTPLISLRSWGGAVRLKFFRVTASVVDDGAKR